MAGLNGYRKYYDKTYEDLLAEELKYNHRFLATRNAKHRLRMYANLFCRDMRKIKINNNSKCSYCGETKNLVIDHIIPINKGGKNMVNNVQILCSSCNSTKSDK